MTEQNDLDDDVRAVSAFCSFTDLLDSSPTYRPSIRADEYGAPALRVAAAFDEAMERRGDSRRSYVYFKGRDGNLHCCNGVPSRVVSDLLRRACSGISGMEPVDRITLRGLLASVPMDADVLAKRKARLACYNGPKRVRELIENAVVIFRVGISDHNFCCVGPRGSVFLVIITVYRSAKYAEKAGAPGRVDLQLSPFRLRE